MRLVLDTNILLSALMVRGTPPSRLYDLWRERRFELAACERQLDELNQVSRRAFFRARLRPHEVGTMINEIRRLAVMCDTLPPVERSPDPDDDFLLAVAQVSAADYLVTGDRSDLLSLGQHRGTQIVTARLALQKIDK